MPDPPAIPGFYYDSEKKKYFKIQKTGLAPPGAKYSQDAVNQRESLSKKRKREQSEKTQREAQTLKRSPMLTNASSWTLTRERGLRPDPDARAKALASVLKPSAFIELHDYWHRHVHPGNTIRSFDYDALGLTLVAGFSGPANCLTSTFVDPYQTLLDGVAIHRGLKNPKSTPSWHRRMHHPTNSDITSVNIGPKRTLMYTTLGSSTTAEIHLSSLNLHLPSQNGDQDYFDWSVVLGPHEPDTMWSGTVNRFVTDKDIFSIGTGKGVVNIEMNPDGPHYSVFSAVRGKRDDRPDDALSVEWLSPSILCAGFRSGHIVLYDSRTKASTLRLGHPSSVIQIRRADFDSGLVVAGLKSNMNLYDLRMAGPYKKKHTSKSVFRFNYANEVTTSVGLDVHRESGIVAATQKGGVQLYSIKNGAKLRHFDTKATEWKDMQYASTPHVTCLRFVEEVKGPEKGRTKLLGSIGTRVVQFR